MNENEIYVVEYHAGGAGSSRKQLSEYAPHFYGLETKDYLPLKVILGGTQPNPWRELWHSLLDDIGILGDDKPDTLDITGLSADQCDEYTSLVLELLHKESEQ